jgi:monoamine oxidase
MTINRRDLLKASAALAAMALPAANVLAASNQRVLVIGAGMAGIACAKQLLANGNTVTILEARNRSGGRIWTSRKWGDVPIDLGASWIHERDGNPLTPIAQNAGLALADTDLDSFTTFYKTQGKVANGAGSYYESVYDDYDYAINKGYNTGTEKSLRSFLESSSGLNYAAKPAKYRDYASHLTVAWGDMDYAGDSADLSCWYWDSMSGYNGLDAVLPGGYDQLINVLANGLDIRLNHVVNKIAHTSSGITVTTNAGIFTADRVVVTVPLGVLKSGAILCWPYLSWILRCKA